MSDHVDEILRLWRTTPFTWGGVLPHKPGYGDCLLSVGEYAALRGAPDYTGEYRGLYDTEEGAQAQMVAWGGAAALIDRLGFPETDTPKRGDIVLIDPVGDGDCVGGIHTGDGIAVRLERGVVEINARFVKITKAWNTP